jgi:transposase
MNKKFTPEFKLECAQLIVDKSYSFNEASKTTNVGKASLNKWVRTLKNERNSVTNKFSVLTPEEIEIIELKQKITHIEHEKEILKKAIRLIAHT